MAGSPLRIKYYGFALVPSWLFTQDSSLPQSFKPFLTIVQWTLGVVPVNVVLSQPFGSVEQPERRDRPSLLVTILVYIHIHF